VGSLDGLLPPEWPVPIVTGAEGYASIEREQFARLLKSEPWELRRYELLGEPAVRFLGPDVAVVAYRWPTSRRR
jgi:hypothetical protein